MLGSSCMRVKDVRGIGFITVLILFLTGCGGSDGITTNNGPDTDSPTVTSTLPANNASDVAVTTNVTVTFSENIDAATITTGSFRLENGSIPVSGTLAVASDNLSATFTPNSDLAFGAEYTATITTDVTDVSGNSLALGIVLQFTTIADTTPPTVTDTTPADSSINVGIDTNVTAVFSEAIDPATVSTSSFTLEYGATSVSGAIAVAGDGLSVIFTPDSPLTYDTSYTATLTTGVTDTYGNGLAADVVWQFTTTPDTVAPDITSITPANNAVGVLVGSNVTAVFSEPMDSTTITNSSFLLQNGTVSVPGSVTVASDGLSATFAPNSDLAIGALYTATITTAVTDVNGNAMEAEVAWQFSTELDTTPPTVTRIIPSTNATSLGGQLTVIFSEAINPATVTTGSFILRRGGATGVAVPGTVVVATDNLSAIFIPDSNLAYNTSYTATLTADITDTNGNALTADVVWQFTTVADTTPPTVSSTIPSNNTTNVSIGTMVTAMFSEPVDPATVTTSSFVLENGSTPVAGTVAVAANFLSATFTPNSDLDFSTQYTATITTGVTDANGNAMTFGVVWQFVTEQDTVAPTVTNTDPANNSNNVDVNTSVTVTFSEPMNANTVSVDSVLVQSGGADMAGTVFLSADMLSATLTPVAALDYNTTYTITLLSSITDLAGNALVLSSGSLTFTTAADTTSPSLSSVTPADGAIDTQADTMTITATFDEDIDCTTVSTNSFSVVEDAAATSVVGSAVCNGTVLEFVPDNVPTSTSLIANLTGQITDLAGNSITPYSWGFDVIPWTRQIGPTVDDRNKAIASDSNGNIYIAGSTDASLDGTNVGGQDVFVAKYDRNGARVWVKQFGSTALDSGEGVALDSLGNVYVVGFTHGILPGYTTRGTGADGFIAKFDNNGSRLWINQIITSTGDVARSIAIDNSNNIFIGGYTQFTATQFQLYVSKYNSGGILQWREQLPEIRDVYSVTTDGAGHVYASGMTNGSFDGNTNLGSFDSYVVKFNGSTGAKIWSDQYGTASDDMGSGVITDSLNNVYVTGFAAASLDGQPHSGGYDIYIRKYNSSGVWLWTQQFGSATHDYGFGINVDSSNNIYVSGVTLGDIAGTQGANDAYLVKYNSAGTTRQWINQFGSGGSDEAYNVTVTGSNVFVVGLTDTGLDGITNAAPQELFVVKFNSDGRKR